VPFTSRRKEIKLINQIFQSEAEGRGGGENDPGIFEYFNFPKHSSHTNYKEHLAAKKRHNAYLYLYIERKQFVFI
jgi:hypothetical protein